MEAIGRRKTAVARVRLFPEIKEKTFLINKKKSDIYFSDFELQKIVSSPLEKTNLIDNFRIEIQVRGGGKRGQAEAVRLALSRVLVKKDEKLREILRTVGYMTRDSREVERKKFGRKKARRSPQWSKR
ncbi:MAG: 30S ribosomal protein S9 [Patescibacteria group bacterium]